MRGKMTRWNKEGRPKTRKGREYNAPVSRWEMNPNVLGFVFGDRCARVSVNVSVNTPQCLCV